MQTKKIIEYDLNEVSTSVNENYMKELLLPCTKNVHFTFDKSIYTQIDRVFITELEQTIILQLSDVMSPWQRYVDDTFATVKEEAIQTILK